MCFLLSLSAPKGGPGKALGWAPSRASVPGPLGGPAWTPGPSRLPCPSAVVTSASVEGVAVEPKGRGEDFRGMPPAGEKKEKGCPLAGAGSVRTHRTSPRVDLTFGV